MREWTAWAAPTDASDKLVSVRVGADSATGAIASAHQQLAGGQIAGEAWRTAIDQAGSLAAPEHRPAMAGYPPQGHCGHPECGQTLMRIRWSEVSWHQADVHVSELADAVTSRGDPHLLERNRSKLLQEWLGPVDDQDDASRDGLLNLINRLHHDERADLIEVDSREVHELRIHGLTSGQDKPFAAAARDLLACLRGAIEQGDGPPPGTCLASAVTGWMRDQGIDTEDQP